tara:strand:- start:1677 stop:1937 length:261 start_codon:yes stop_codon:yes gene_type:complete
MTTIINAINAINPNSEASVSNEDLNKITWHDGNPTNITDQQILDKQAELVIEKAEAKTKLATDKTNGNQKLLDLGLSQAEVDAITK